MYSKELNIFMQGGVGFVIINLLSENTPLWISNFVSLAPWGALGVLLNNKDIIYPNLGKSFKYGMLYSSFNILLFYGLYQASKFNIYDKYNSVILSIIIIWIILSLLLSYYLHKFV